MKHDNGINLQNETAGVTGNKAITITIDIKEQVHQINVAQGVTLSSSEKEDLKSQFIDLLDEALMSAESIIGN